MNPVDAMPRIRKPNNLFRKLVLLFLLTATYALGLILLLPKVPWFPLVLFAVFADGAVAVVAGFSTRLLLSGCSWFTRTSMAALLPVAGMAILGYFSDREIGLDVYALRLGYLSWVDVIQLSAGIMASWATLWAWGRPKRREAPTGNSVEPVRSAQVVEPRRVQSTRSWSLGTRLRLGSSLAPQSRRISRVRPRLAPGTPSRPRRARRSLLQRPHVTLALVEEHRCPYCLEPVLRTDGRGVKECEVCHTLHHADCWAITGSCQVPHLNS
jgi:hypothetical protein